MKNKTLQKDYERIWPFDSGSSCSMRSSVKALTKFMQAEIPKGDGERLLLGRRKGAPDTTRVLQKGLAPGAAQGTWTPLPEAPLGARAPNAPPGTRPPGPLATGRGSAHLPRPLPVWGEQPGQP